MLLLRRLASSGCWPQLASLKLRLWCDERGGPDPTPALEAAASLGQSLTELHLSGSRVPEVAPSTRLADALAATGPALARLRVLRAWALDGRSASFCGALIAAATQWSRLEVLEMWDMPWRLDVMAQSWPRLRELQLERCAKTPGAASGGCQAGAACESLHAGRLHLALSRSAVTDGYAALCRF